MSPTPTDEVTPEMAPALADRFVEMARAVNSVELDYSVSSLRDVDNIIEGMRKEGLKPRDVYRLLFTAGCYVGEVIIRAKDLKWVSARDTSYADHQDFLPLVVEYADNAYTSPLSKVFKRMVNGEEDSLPYYFEVLSKIMEEPPGMVK